MNFLEFINKYKNTISIKESFKNDDKFDKYIDTITDLLKKHIDNLYALKGYEETISDNKKYLSKQYVVFNKKKSSWFQLNWSLSENDKELYSVDFFDNINTLFKGQGKSALSIYTNGSSAVYFMPIIWNVVKGQNYNISQKEAISYGRTVFNKQSIKEYKLNFGTLKYHIMEDNGDDVEDYLEKKRKAMDQASSEITTDPDAKDRYYKLSKEYYDMLRAYRGGQASTISELELLVKHGVNVKINPSSSEQKYENELRSHKEDPEITFKKMEQYVKMVIKGSNPSLILCGAPGLGKTFRVKKLLKDNGYEHGKNLLFIKGKCTPRILYLSLYNYKDKGDIIVIDDADGLVGPKAPEECINILKNALDSTSDAEGRLVQYGVAGKILDDDGNALPKSFYYNGSVIVITNYNAGSLDTALRGRSFIQDIHFSTEDVLLIIKRLLPKLGENKLSMESKYKAYDELVALSKETDFEISIRTFNICATFFESIDDEDLAKSMIREQMALQTIRSKNTKY